MNDATPVDAGRPDVAVRKSASESHVEPITKTIKLMTLLGNDEDFTINPNADLEAVVDHINSKTGRPRGVQNLCSPQWHRAARVRWRRQGRTKIKGMVSDEMISPLLMLALDSDVCPTSVPSPVAPLNLTVLASWMPCFRR